MRPQRPLCDEPNFGFGSYPRVAMRLVKRRRHRFGKCHDRCLGGLLRGLSQVDCPPPWRHLMCVRWLDGLAQPRHQKVRALLRTECQQCLGGLVPIMERQRKRAPMYRQECPPLQKNERFWRGFRPQGGMGPPRMEGASFPHYGGKKGPPPAEP